MSWNVFYAWQSDRPGNVNKNLILTALEAAVEQVRAEGSVVVDPRVDRDTLNVPGAPDIVATIFEKIDAAAVFVADVTLVTADSAGRPTPNPNVLIELGYALKSLGPNRIITVMNTVYGPPDDLPFDIRQKRTLTYSLPQDAPEKAPERRRLQKVLVDAIRMGLEAAERERPKPPSPPSAAEAFVKAIEEQSPAQRASARRYVASVVATAEVACPPAASDDEALVTAITSSKAVILEFARVAEAIATYDARDAAEELQKLFAEFVRRYDPPAGFSGSFQRTDFDFYKFLAHELFVVLVAKFIQEERWQGLDALLRLPLSVIGGSRPDRVRPFSDISKSVDMLNVVRRNRLRTGQTERISVHADLLKERYADPDLAGTVSWELFLSADFFLYLRSCTVPEESRVWRPWSVLYLHGMPDFIQRAVRQDYLRRLAQGLGVTKLDTLPRELQQHTQALGQFYRSAFWDPPGRGFAWDSLGTR